MTTHASSCALHRGPALTPGPCDCGADPGMTPERYGSEMPNHFYDQCPFCGGSNLESGGDDKFVGVRCLDCEATGPNHYITGRDWNTRALLPAQAQPESFAAMLAKEMREGTARFISPESTETDNALSDANSHGVVRNPVHARVGDEPEHRSGNAGTSVDASDGVAAVGDDGHSEGRACEDGLDQVRNLIADAALPFARRKGSSGLRGWCEHHNIACSHTVEFMQGKRGPATSILNALGLEWRVVHKVDDAALRAPVPEEGGVLQDDLQELLCILNMPMGAQPHSPHVVFQRALMVLRKRLSAPSPRERELRKAAEDLIETAELCALCFNTAMMEEAVDTMRAALLQPEAEAMADTLKTFFSDLAAKQEPLGAEFETVLAQVPYATDDPSDPQPAREPVAWRWRTRRADNANEWNVVDKFSATFTDKCIECEPLYAAAPASPPKAVPTAVPPFAETGYGAQMLREAMTYLSDYVFDCGEDSSDHEPNEFERNMLEDFTYGLMSHEPFFGVVRAIADRFRELVAKIDAAPSSTQAVSEEDVARVLRETEYEGYQSPWDEADIAEQDEYLRMARAMIAMLPADRNDALDAIAAWDGSEAFGDGIDGIMKFAEHFAKTIRANYPRALTSKGE